MRKPPISYMISHLLLIALVITVLMPGQKEVESPVPFLVAIGLFELVFIALAIVKRGHFRYGGDIMCILWGFFLFWEVMTTQLDRSHPVLIPAPENVFHVFATRYPELLEGVMYSLQLLFVGGLLGIAVGTMLGLFVGWMPRLRDVFYPIAQVLAPISPIIYAPYLVAMMPTFRSASMLIIFLGVFLPLFLNTILRVGAIEQRILDSACVLGVKGPAMVTKILLPYLFPGIISGLKVTLTTSITMLTFAEMMGATSGMGYFIINYAHYANYTNVVAGILLVGVVVTLLNAGVTWIQKKTIRF